MLLVLRDDKGTLESGVGMYHLALGGAVLSELLLAGRIRIEEGKKGLVDLVSDRRMDDPILDECLELVATAKRRGRAVHWVSKFGSLKRLHHRIALGLCRKGILKDDEDKVLLIFTRSIYPTIDPRPEERLLARMRDAIFGESRELDPEIVVLVALAHGTGLLNIHFDKKRLKERKRRIEEIGNGDLVGAATAEAVKAAQQAAQAAVLAAIIASTVVTSTSH
jgi:hypothetical protein